MKRQLFNMISLASLLLLLAACPLWVRSHLVRDRLHVRPGRSDRMIYVVSDRGSLACISMRGDNEPELRPRRAGLESHGVDEVRSTLESWGGPSAFVGGLPGGDWSIQGGGFIVRHIRRWKAVAIFVPFWFVVVCGSAAPACWLLSQRRKRRRLRLGLCPRCGYDLTANASGVCPECGQPADHPFDPAAPAAQTKSEPEPPAQAA